MRKSLLRLRSGTLCAIVLFALLTLTGTVCAQDNTVTGIVLDEDNSPLPGVSVLVKNSRVGTVTDADGKFTINATGDAVLVFSFIGLTTQEISVNGQSTISVTMKADATLLGEVVVIGYGTQKKSDLTGAVASVQMKELSNVPITRADQMLQGRISGVQVTQTNAEPGGNVSIRIRGTNSINSSNEPLFVIDGFPGAGDLNSINPSDIESIDVLKDASATAIYGSRGANGVVIITTKKGKAGTDGVTFEAYTGVQSIRHKYDMMNATEFGQYLNDVQTLNNTENKTSVALPYPNQSDIDALGKGTDWQDEIFRTAPIRNYQLGFNGGNDKTRYNLSMNYFDQGGIIINSGFKRGSIRLNLDRKISNKLNFSFTSQLTRSSENRALVNTAGGSASGVVMDALRINPAVPVIDPATGTYTLRNSPLPYVESQVGNPVAYANLASDRRNVTRALLNAAFDYEIVKGLKLRISGGTDLYNGYNDYYVPSGIYFQNTTTVGNATKATINRYSWLNENTLTYDKEINEHHSITAMGGMSMQKFDNNYYNTSVQGFFTDELEGNSIGIATTILSSGSGQNPNQAYQLLSYFGRLNYRIDDKYLFTFTMRADGSSRFGANNKFGYFPSGAFAWKIMDENFMSNVRQMSDLKLRLGYGVVGNQETPSYQSLVRYSSGRDYVSGTTRLIGVSKANIPNPDLGWESTASFNIGIDAGFLENRITLTADYYDKTTRDLLLQVAIPQVTGFSNMLLNSGKVGNKGFELSITSVNIDGSKFRWTSNLNFSRNRNKVLNLNGEYQRFVGQSSGSLFPGTSGNGTSVLRVGEPIGSFYGYQFEGIFQTAEEIAASGITTAGLRPGDPHYADMDGNGIINNDDRVIIGRALPKFTYGFTNTFSYSRLNLMILLQGVQGSDILNLNRYELESGTINTNKMRTMLDRWTGEGTSNTIPKANSTLRRSTGVTSDIVEDGSFLRIKTVSLGYDLPIPKSIGQVVKSANIYVTAQNLVTWTKYTGFDPEVNSFGQDNSRTNPGAADGLSLGTDYNAYPTSRTFTAGIKLGF
jgi:TonB-linked SusC/RagA family outer membrane protein